MLQRIVICLSLLWAIEVVCAPQMPPQPAKKSDKTKEAPAPVAQEPAKPAPSKFERAAWSCDRDYEHYIQCLRDYADSLKGVDTIFAKNEFARITAELALVAQYKERAAQTQVVAQQLQALEQPLHPGSVSQAQLPAPNNLPAPATKNVAPKFVVRAMLEDGREVLLHLTLSDQLIAIENISFIPR